VTAALNGGKPDTEAKATAKKNVRSAALPPAMAQRRAGNPHKTHVDSGKQ